MRPYRIALMAWLISLGCCVSISLAWWPLAHGLLGVDSGLNISPGYHQAPDTWPSYDANHLTDGIKDEFCWGHVTPRYWLYWCPRPWYYGYGTKYQENDPAEHMRLLIEKLLPEHQVLPKMEDFRKGFAAHNAEDQGGPAGKHTHYDLAPGGEDFYTAVLWEKHAPVEKAIEKIAYVDICYGGDANIAFDPNGDPVGLPTSPVNYAAMIGSSVGDAETDGLLCLAMKAFRKKQQTVDLNPAHLKALTPLSRSDIGQLRSSCLGMSSTLLRFTRSDYTRARETLLQWHYVIDEEGQSRLVPPDSPEGPNWAQYYDAAKQAASAVQ